MISVNRELPPYLSSQTIPDYLREAMSLPFLRRLLDVGMHCGLEYTSYPYFSKVEPYNRFEHSVGVALLCLRFSSDPKVALAGLFHDISTPCFAHVIDFLEGDHEKQEATESKTEAMLKEDPGVLAFLTKLGIPLESVSDYHRYPIADNDAPRLSCDRLEYTLSNFLHFGVYPLSIVEGMLDDLCLTRNEDGEEEIAFLSLESALLFGKGMLKNADMYTRDEDRFAMEALSRLLRSCLKDGTLVPSDLYGVESALIEKLLSSPRKKDWLAYRGLSLVTREPLDQEGMSLLFSSSIKTKKRFIDPLVKGKGRLSSLSKEFASDLSAFLALSFDSPLWGYSKAGPFSF